MNASEAVGASPPPPGVKPNFTNPESIGYRIIIIAVIFPIVTIPLSFLRLYTKRYIVGAFHTDDYLIVVGVLFALAFSILTCYSTTNGLGLHLWDVPLHKYSRFLKIGGIAGPIFYNISTLFTKVSLIEFYLRFAPSRTFTYVAYTTMAITIIYSLLTAFAFAFLCQPIQKYWDFSAPGSCVDISTFGVAMSTVNVVVDVTLLLLPPRIILALPSLSLWRKIILAFILMAGSFVCIVSIIRLQVIISWTKEPHLYMDVTRTMVTTISWALVEMWCGIICANLPNLRAFISRYFPRLTGADAEQPQKPSAVNDLEWNPAVLPNGPVDQLVSSDLISSTNDNITLANLENDRLDDPFRSTSTVVPPALCSPPSEKSHHSSMF